MRARQTAAVDAPHAGDQGSGQRVVHVADGVHRHERRDLQAVGKLDQRGSDAALHGAVGAGQLADGGAGAGADAAFLDGLVGGGSRCPVPAVRGRAHGRVAHAEVVQDCGGHDRHARRPRPIADALLVEVAHHPVGGGQAERAAARKHDGVYLLDGIDRIEKRRFTRSGRRAPHVHRGGRAPFAEDDRATGRTGLQRMMSDLDAGDGGQPTSGRHGAFRSGAGPGGRDGGADDDAGACC